MTICKLLFNKHENICVNDYWVTSVFPTAHCQGDQMTFIAWWRGRLRTKWRRKRIFDFFCMSSFTSSVPWLPPSHV